MGDRVSAGEVYAFLQLMERVAGDDVSIRRRVEALSPAARGVVAREVLDYARGMETDETGKYLTMEAIRRALLSIGG